MPVVVIIKRDTSLLIRPNLPSSNMYELELILPPIFQGRERENSAQLWFGRHVMFGRDCQGVQLHYHNNRQKWGTRPCLSSSSCNWFLMQGFMPRLNMKYNNYYRNWICWSRSPTGANFSRACQTGKRSTKCVPQQIL